MRIQKASNQENLNLNVEELNQKILDNKSLLKVGQENLKTLLESSRVKNISKPQADLQLNKAELTQQDISNI